MPYIENDEMKLTNPSFAELQNYVHKVIVFKKTVKGNNVIMIKTTMNRNFLSHFVFLVRLDK